MKDILLVGYGGHARSIADCIEESGLYNIYGYTDVEDNCCEYRYLGTDDALEDIYRSGVHLAFVSVGYLGKNNTREKLYDRLKQIGFELPVIISSSAVVAKKVEIGEGTFVGKSAVINAGVDIGSMCIINTCAIVEHDCKIGNFSHISVGSVLCGGVNVGTAAFVGANATVIHNKTVDEGSIVPAGAVIR